MAVRAGDLQERVAFDPPANVADGYGGVTPGWGAAHECRAHYRFLRGGEAVQQARLAGRQVIVATIRSTATSRTITPAWRMRDRRTDRVFNVRSVEPTPDRLWLEILIEGGEEV